MSGFIRSAVDGVMPNTMKVDDRRGSDNVQPGNGPRGSDRNNFEEGMLWSGPRIMQSGQGIAQQDASQGEKWGPFTESAGNMGRKILSGTTRNAGGGTLGGVAVQAIRQDGSSCDGTATSDSLGYYEIPVANPSGTYKVDGYLAGSPDLAGTTLNTLVPV